MSFYYLQEEMGLALNDILDRVCSNNIENLRNDIAITWINYKSESNHINKGFGFGINNRKLIYPASIVKLIYGLAAYSWICLLYTSPSPRDATLSRMPSSA